MEDILPIIISYVPRTIIINVVLTCKLFKKHVNIITNQEEVAKTGDMYSLRQINYSTKVVLKIAFYHHIYMIDYLFNKHQIKIYNETSTSREENDIIYTPDMLHAIGVYGNEKLINTICICGFTWTTHYIKFGLMEGNHLHVLKKFEPYDFYSSIKHAYQNNNPSLIDYDIDINDPLVKCCIVEGTCAQPCDNNVKLYIESFNDDFINEYFYQFCMGLMVGGHYHLFLHLIQKINIEFRVLCYPMDSHPIRYLIHKNHH